MLAAIDLGVTQTKVSAGGRTGKFASLVAPVPAGAIRLPGGGGGMEVALGGVSYYVDDKAAHDSEAANYPVHQQALDAADDVRFCGALGMLKTTEGTHVVTGLPVHEYALLKERLTDHLRRTWNFRMNSRELSVPVDDVTVIPQGAGAYYAAVLNMDGSMADPARARRKVLVLDIGGRTVNAVTMERSRFRGKTSFTIFRGMVHVYNGLRRAIYRQHGALLTLYEVGEVLRNGALPLGDNLTPLDGLLGEAVNPVWQDIQDQLELELPSWPTYQEVLVAGGGATVFEERVRRFFVGVPVIVLDNPEYANVRGYEAFGALQKSRISAIPSGK